MAVGLSLAALTATVAYTTGKEYETSTVLALVSSLVSLASAIVLSSAPWGAAASLLPSHGYEAVENLLDFKDQQDIWSLNDEPVGDVDECKLRAPRGRPLGFFSLGFGSSRVYARSTGILKAGM
jgi:hypothetical protein